MRAQGLKVGYMELPCERICREDQLRAAASPLIEENERKSIAKA